MRKSSQEYYRQKGVGRPTKKDRRDMDDYSADGSAEDMDGDDWDAFFKENTESED